MAGDADYLPWSETVSLIKRLQEDGNPKMCLVVAFLSFWGIKMGQLLSLKWCDVCDRDNFTIDIINRKKHLIQRVIPVVPDIKKLIDAMLLQMNVVNKNQYIFTNPKSLKVYTIQNINQLINKLGKQYNLSVSQPTTHTFRRSFGRHYWELDSKSRKSLVQLSEFYGNDRLTDTMRYLGITPEEILPEKGKGSNERFKL